MTNPETTTAPTHATPMTKDAIALLKADHVAVSELFADDEKTRSIAKKHALVADICTAARMAARNDELMAQTAFKVQRAKP